jgi:spermidine/putrescine transport system ATP-binding protein
VVGETLLEIRHLSKSFGGLPVLKGISLMVRRGEFLTLLGPSGCGKTTTLRLIAGFEEPDSGRVLLSGQDVTPWAPYHRDVHTVFQHYALFPHYDVYENIAFGLRLKKFSESEIRGRVSEALGLVKLPGFEKRTTHQLSGGQMQRIALARALVGRPSLLLLDEPLGALDLKLRREMQIELKAIQRKLGLAFVYVTHDQEEAMAISDRIAVFNQGLIEQVGSPEEIYERPKTSFVADFIGSANLLTAELLEASAGRLKLRLENELDVELPYGGPPPVSLGGKLKVAIRPERIGVRYKDSRPGEEGTLCLKASLVDNVYLGNTSQIYLLPFQKPGKVLVAISMDSQHRIKKESGTMVWADIQTQDLLLLESTQNSCPT